MKKCLILLAFLVSVCAFAQRPEGAPQGGGRPKGFQPGQFPEGFQMPQEFKKPELPAGLEYLEEIADMLPADQAKYLTEMMNNEVGLSEKQYKKVFALFKRDFKHREYLGGGGGMMMGGPMMGPPMMGGPNSSLDDEYFQGQDAKLQKILTAEQHSKWRENHPVEQAAKSNFGDLPFPGGFPGGGPGGPPPMMGGFGGPF